MALVVQKYGGTSVGSVARIQAVAQRIRQTVASGDRVTAVVSAMGKTTDGLVSLARELSPQPNRREMDVLLSTGEQISIALLSIALQELGQPAISLTGAQVGIVTEASHSRARILQIATDRLARHLDEGKVVVVAGFQGVSSRSDLEITTLGRGGSDTSAVALAVALGADRCEIYTDVPGILTTDPRLVPEARLMEEITCDEMLELASLGAKVLHPRAVELARNYGVPLVVRSSWTDDPGTRVLSPVSRPRSLENLELSQAVDAVEVDTAYAKVALLRVPDAPGVAARLFSEIAAQKVDVETIVQAVHEGNTNDIAFTVRREEIPHAIAVAEALVPVLSPQAPRSPQAPEVVGDPEIATVSIRGVGTMGRPEVAAAMFAALAEEGINILTISSSEVKVSCSIARHRIDDAIAVLCRTFEISNCPVRDVAPTAAEAPVRGAALDRAQARIAIRHIPDRPGSAASVLKCLAERQVRVDTIVQSERCRIVDGIPSRDITFTVAQSDADLAMEALQALAPSLGCGEISLDRAVAKVSVVGVGMLGYPGVAARTFAALAERGVNILAIATSEIKISCVVAEDQGAIALQAVHAAFDLAALTRN